MPQAIKSAAISRHRELARELTYGSASLLRPGLLLLRVLGSAGGVRLGMAEAVKSLKLEMPTASELAGYVETLRRQKYDHLIPDGLLRAAFARSRISTEGLMATLDTLSF